MKLIRWTVTACFAVLITLAAAGVATAATSSLTLA